MAGDHFYRLHPGSGLALLVGNGSGDAYIGLQQHGVTRVLSYCAMLVCGFWAGYIATRMVQARRIVSGPTPDQLAKRLREAMQRIVDDQQD